MPTSRDLSTAGSTTRTGVPLQSPQELQRTPSAHLVGVGGSGMKALAELLSSRGWRVSGSDQQIAPTMAAALSRRGLAIHRGHDRQNLPELADCLVYSPAVSPENPERIRAAERGIPQYSYTQMLGSLMAGKTGVSLAGTHGKSTTTAMTGCILTVGGLNPSVVCGAELLEYAVSGWSGSGDLFVAESCEYHRNFLDLRPKLAAILAIEADHFDCFAGLPETIAAFGDFAAQLPSDGWLLLPADLPAATAVAERCAATIETFAVSELADSTASWRAADVRSTREGVRFRVFHNGEFLTEVSLQVHGLHNVKNALAAAAVSHRAGADAKAIRNGLAEFLGIRRRFELLGMWRGVTLYDDYAHHPTAVRATLETARLLYPNRRIWAVFQPHQVSRTRALMNEFADSFAACDQVLVAPVYAARETVRKEPQEVAAELAELISQRGIRARNAWSLDRIQTTLEDELSAGDILITLGAGDISQIHHEFTRQLQRHHAAR